MTDILTNSASIPYGTWGGGRSLTQSKTISIPANNVPYTYSPLTSNIYISTDVTDITVTVIDNMVNYAADHIPNYTTITEIPKEHLPKFLDTSNAQNWAYAFNGCSNITSLPDPFYTTSNMNYSVSMFKNCSNLTTVPNFDTSKVTYTSSMFNNCTNLTSVPNFDTSNVTEMSGMFNHCTSLTTVPNFDMSNVVWTQSMFENCTSLTTVPNFDMSNVIYSHYMFANCTSLTTVPNFNFNTSRNDIRFTRFFANCTNLTSVPNFNTNTTFWDRTFYGCSNLKYIPILNYKGSLAGLFANCYNIRGDLYFTGHVSSVCGDIFANCPNYEKNIYVYSGSSEFLRDNMSESKNGFPYNSNWNCYLKTIEGNYAEIFPEPIDNYTGVGSIYIVRFPTNKVQLCRPDGSNSYSIVKNTIEVTPYTDYVLKYDLVGKVTRIASTTDYTVQSTWWFDENEPVTPSLPGAPIFSFRFFKDIPNMTANVVDLL